MPQLSLQFFVVWFTLGILINCKDNRFVQNHWEHPINIQDSFTEKNSPLSIWERNFEPKQCGTCHAEQWNRWKDSFHAKSIGNGFLWQKEILKQEEWDRCLNCHSPLPETKAKLSQTFQSKEVLTSQKNHFPRGIDNPSIQCATCHIRKEIVYGPPSKNKLSKNVNTNPFPHNGFQVRDEFTKSEFCESCHQSPNTGVTINGKQLMETYKEWEKTSFAKQDIQCQNCHMLNREHSWKGIHDREFVQNAIKTDWKVQKTSKNELYIRAELKSIGVGHKFPTYLIPKVSLRFYAIDSLGKRILMEESIIGRLLNTELTEEYYDTRIESNGFHIVEFSYPIHNQKIEKVLWEIEVDPDEHYIRSFEESLKRYDSELSLDAKKQLSLSLFEKRESRYILFTSSLPVPVSLPQ